VRLNDTAVSFTELDKTPRSIGAFFAVLKIDE
jgi:hypothetical protein